MFTASAYAQMIDDPDSPPTGEELEGVVQEAIEVPAEQGPDAGGFPPFEPTFFASQLLWLAITFGLFYLFLNKVVLPRIGGTLEVRSDRIAQDLDQAARMKEEADAAVAAYEQDLAEARAKAGTIAQQARDEAKAEAEAERKEIEKSLDSRLAEAERRIAIIKDTAMNDVGQIAQETASAIVEQLVGVRADKASVNAAVKNAGG